MYPKKNIHRFYLIELDYCLLINMFIILSYFCTELDYLFLQLFVLLTCFLHCSHELKRRKSTTQYVKLFTGLVLPVVSTDPQPIVELRPNAVLQCLHEQPPDKVKSIVTEPTSICDAAAREQYHNYIGLAVGHQLSIEDRIKYLEPWMPTYASEFPSSVRVGQQSHTKSVVERRRRLLPRHLEDFPWLAVSRVNPGAFCVPCVLFTASGAGVGGRSRGHGQDAVKLVTKPLDHFDNLTGKDGSLTRHAKTMYHQDATLAFDDLN